VCRLLRAGAARLLLLVFVLVLLLLLCHGVLSAGVSCAAGVVPGEKAVMTNPADSLPLPCAAVTAGTISQSCCQSEGPSAWASRKSLALPFL
jgi:hypothetical protein